MNRRYMPRPTIVKLVTDGRDVLRYTASHYSWEMEHLPAFQQGAVVQEVERAYHVFRRQMHDKVAEPSIPASGLRSTPIETLECHLTTYSATSPEEVTQPMSWESVAERLRGWHIYQVIWLDIRARIMYVGTELDPSRYDLALPMDLPVEVVEAVFRNAAAIGFGLGTKVNQLIREFRLPWAFIQTALDRPDPVAELQQAAAADVLCGKTWLETVPQTRYRCGSTPDPLHWMFTRFMARPMYVEECAVLHLEAPEWRKYGTIELVFLVPGRNDLELFLPHLYGKIPKAKVTCTTCRSYTAELANLCLQAQMGGQMARLQVLAQVQAMLEAAPDPGALIGFRTSSAVSGYLSLALHLVQYYFQPLDKPILAGLLPIPLTGRELIEAIEKTYSHMNRVKEWQNPEAKFLWRGTEDPCGDWSVATNYDLWEKVRKVWAEAETSVKADHTTRDTLYPVARFAGETALLAVLGQPQRLYQGTLRMAGSSLMLDWTDGTGAHALDTAALENAGLFLFPDRTCAERVLPDCTGRELIRRGKLYNRSDPAVDAVYEQLNSLDKNFEELDLCTVPKGWLYGLVKLRDGSVGVIAIPNPDPEGLWDPEVLACLAKDRDADQAVYVFPK